MKYLLNFFLMLSLFHYECYGLTISELNINDGYHKKKKGRFKQKQKQQFDNILKTNERPSYYDSHSSRSSPYDDSEEGTAWYEDPIDYIWIKYIRQNVDHLDPTRSNVWYMKCMQNTVFWSASAPIYLYVGSNQPLEIDLLNRGLMYELAQETGGVMFAAEHRFYGEDDMDFGIHFLHSQQAIEDLRNLLASIKKEPVYSRSKVVAVGGGYGGSLAVWLKAKYPELVHAVIASGAPLLAKLDFDEYFTQVKADFEKYAPKACVTYLQNAFTNFTNCNGTLRECVRLLKPICDFVNMDLQENYVLYFLRISSIFSDSAEKGIAAMHRVCRSLHSVEEYVRDTDLFYDRNGDCNDYDYQDFVEIIRNSDYYVRVKYWLYQCCNEFGFFSSTLKVIPEQPFITLEFYIKLCRDLFRFDERRIREGIEYTNDRYGGKNPKITNVIFTHGTLDPWQHLGVVEKFDSVEVIMINGVSHCRDLLPQSETDPKPLLAAKNEIKYYIRNLILYDTTTVTKKPTKMTSKLTTKMITEMATTTSVTQTIAAEPETTATLGLTTTTVPWDLTSTTVSSDLTTVPTPWCLTTTTLPWGLTIVTAPKDLTTTTKSWELTTITPHWDTVGSTTGSTFSTTTTSIPSVITISKNTYFPSKLTPHKVIYIG